MNNIFKKVLMCMILVLLVLCVPVFAEDVNETEASFDIEKEIEEAEKDFVELIEMEGPEAENKIKNETYESEEREVVVEPKEEIEPKEELTSVEPETEVETEALESDAFEPTDFEPVEAETETIETEIFEPTAEPIEEEYETEYEVEPEEDVVSEVVAPASDIESEALIESASEEESEVEEESGVEKESIDESKTIVEPITETETEAKAEAEIKTETEKETITETATEAKAEVATTSTLDETIVPEDLDDTVATISEASDGKCEVVVYWLTDMKLKEQGNGGSYNYSWDKFLIDKGSEFAIDENIPCVIKHSSCEQEYTLIGFTTENQKDNYWKGADYAGGDATLDKNFVVDGDMEIFAVYEAKDTYISSIIIDNEVTYKTTTIPNKAIKNIRIIDDNNENDAKVVCIENVNYYKIKNNLNDVNYMFTKDSSKGAPIKVEGFSLESF